MKSTASTSFSFKGKNEICRATPKRNCCRLAELAALIHTSGTIRLAGKERVSLKISTENAFIARRIFTLIKSLTGESPEILVRRNRRFRKNNNYVLLIAKPDVAKKILEDTCILFQDAEGNMRSQSDIDKRLVRRPCCRKSYHLELIAHSEKYGESLCRLVREFGLHAKLIERKNNYVVYLKEGEHIVTLLSLIGAHTALLNLENIRIYKDMRNHINRIVNCETANLSKTINASVRQVENIEYIRDRIGFSCLPPNLREVAELRLSFPDASLRELGERMIPRMGKSGVNHRLRKLDQIAEDHRGTRGCHEI